MGAALTGVWQCYPEIGGGGLIHSVSRCCTWCIKL